jgi:hypothetical protein
VAETSTTPVVLVLVGNIVSFVFPSLHVPRLWKVFYFFCLVGLQDYKTQPLQPLQSNLSLLFNSGCSSGLCATKPCTS